MDSTAKQTGHCHLSILCYSRKRKLFCCNIRDKGRRLWECIVGAFSSVSMEWREVRKDFLEEATSDGCVEERICAKYSILTKENGLCTNPKQKILVYLGNLKNLGIITVCDLDVRKRQDGGENEVGRHQRAVRGAIVESGLPTEAGGALLGTFKHSGE